MTTPQSTAIPAYSSTPVQPTTYIQQPQKRSGAWKWLLGGAGCVVFLILACGLCGYLMFSASSLGGTGIESLEFTAKTVSGTGEEVVAIIDISGMLEDFDGGESLLSGSISSADAVNKMIDYAVDEQKADAILFRLNTPGGTLTSAETICHKIKEVRGEGVYTMAWIETEGASGGYYIASCTDWIAARQESITGSIGVVIQIIDINAFLESIGFKVRTITNTEGTLKSGDDIFTPGSDTDKIYTEILNEGYDQFITAVAEGRLGKDKKLTKTDIIELADGRVYTGKQAYTNGLVDELAYQEDAIDSVIANADLSSDATVIEITRQVAWFDSFYTSTVGKLFPVEVTVQQPGMTVMAISTY